MYGTLGITKRFTILARNKNDNNNKNMKNHKYKSGDTIMYRDTEYTYKEWSTWDNKPASGFTCQDETLLDGIDLASFSTMTEEQMWERIDDHIDNKEHHLELQRLHNAGCQAYYDSKTRWDNYTGD